MRRSICFTSLLLLAVLFTVAATDEKVVIKEWDVPTPHSRPHDPAVGTDGALWYTGQMANKVGRFDPNTQQFKEFPLKTPDSGPHGLVADTHGNIWFTAVFKGYVGKLNPTTGEVTEYHMPDPAAKDPHTPVFDQNGILWFTTEESNFVGRLDPNTGEVKLKAVPTPHAVPYGIVVLPSGVPFFCEFGSNKLASIDPKTMQITEYEVSQGAHPRRLAVAKDGTIFYTDYARGYLGHFDPASKKVEEWKSPGGGGSEPYGITVTPDGIVWYAETGVKPNTLVRFDPKSTSFSTTQVPSGGGVIRNMAATKDGKVYLACSGVNKVGIAQVE